MSKMKKLIQNKKGMTLVEIVVAMVIAMIVIGITGGLLISGTNFFGKTASAVQDQEIARTVLNFTTSQLRFATSLEIDPFFLTDPYPTPTTEQGVIFSFDSSSQNSTVGKRTRLGMIGFKRPGDEGTPVNVFGKSFYHGREVGIRIQCIDPNQPKVLKIFVDVFRDGNLTATDSATIQLPNIPTNQFPTTAHDSPTEHVLLKYTVLDQESAEG